MAVGVSEAAQYGISEALINDPVYGSEIATIYELFKKGDTGAALDALYKSKYYTTMNATVRARKKEQLEQPEVYKDSVEKYKTNARRRLVSSGVKIDEAAFNTIMENAYATGMNDNQVDNAIITSGEITGFGGAVLGDTTALKAYAKQFGVGYLFNDNYWLNRSQDLFAGNITNDDIQAEVRALSASAFPAYAEGILAGTSIQVQTSNVIQSMSTLLERDADSIEPSDPMWKQITQYVDPATGKPMKMPQWMVEKTIKSSPDWPLTNNARDAFDTTTLKVARDMGLM